MKWEFDGFGTWCAESSLKDDAGVVCMYWLNVCDDGVFVVSDTDKVQLASMRSVLNRIDGITEAVR